MAKLNDRVEAELDNIQEVLNRLPSFVRLSSIKELELAGVATLLHNFYNGIENVLKQIISSKGVTIPQGQSWHKDLLELALKHKVITKAVYGSLKQFLGFRHFFSHSYAFHLEVDRLRPLVKAAPKLYVSIKGSIQQSFRKELKRQGLRGWAQSFAKQRNVKNDDVIKAVKKRRKQKLPH